MTTEELKARYGITAGGEKALAYLMEYKLKTDRHYSQYLEKKTKESEEFGKIVSRIMKQFIKLSEGGKRFRGGLVVLGYILGGGEDLNEIRKASLFIEILQTGVLVHDDIMDRDDKRRGIPTIHAHIAAGKKVREVFDNPEHYGEAMALCAGDVALYLSTEKLMESDFPKDRLVEACLYLTKFMQRLGYGQALDVSNNLIDRNDERQILQIMKLKSSEYTAELPITIGMILAGEQDKKKYAAVSKYAEALGWAFQIQDDILGTFGTVEKLGKPVDSDIKEGKFTLLMNHLYKNSSKAEQVKLDKIVGNQKATDKQIEFVRSQLQEKGSLEHVRDLGWSYVKKAIQQIPKITSVPKHQEILESCVVLVMDRAS